MTSAMVRDKLLGYVDTVSLRKGVFTARRGFFYTHGFTADAFARTIERHVPGATVLDSGMVWKAFRGGATVAEGSHFWAKFTVGGS